MPHADKRGRQHRTALRGEGQYDEGNGWQFAVPGSPALGMPVPIPWLHEAGGAGLWELQAQNGLQEQIKLYEQHQALLMMEAARSRLVIRGSAEELPEQQQLQQRTGLQVTTEHREGGTVPQSSSC